MTLKLDVKYEIFRSKGGYLSERQKIIKEYIEDNQPVKVSDIAKRFTEFNIHTIKKDLQYMKKEKAVKSVGKGKGTIYVAYDEEKNT